ncbi:zinc finger protein 414 [Protopterus annectens]|uniref:zinc finger protein 414 n=1 Tax=Protopterus annectens TaxID=7888 RepID=UPI001CF93DF9|nr:zinc finger protein 414 [Protopterus annectens]
MSEKPRSRRRNVASALSSGGKAYLCSAFRCKLSFPSMQALVDHLKTHYRPTQSLDGKTFQCSNLGCKQSFSSMQDLMNHAAVHYKPNRYFKCENCMVRFRTHRSLFKHLHVCSDVSNSTLPDKIEKNVPASLSNAADDSEEKLPISEEMPKLQRITSQDEKDEISSAGMDSVSTKRLSETTSLQEGISSLDKFSLTVVSGATENFPVLDSSLFGPPALTRISGQPNTSMTEPLLSYAQSPFSVPQTAAVQQRLKPYLPNQDLPISNAVWKKNQGHSTNSRILWEHTRDQYKCMQCPCITASREEMTVHIEEHRKNPTSRMQSEMDFGTALAPLHSKLTPEVESSLYSQI